MADSKRKKVLDAALKALLAVSETAWWLKAPATFISELSPKFGNLPDAQQEALSHATPKELTKALLRLETAREFQEAIASGLVRVGSFIKALRDDVARQTRETAAFRAFAENFAGGLEDLQSTIRRVDRTTTQIAADVKDVESIVVEIRGILQQKLERGVESVVGHGQPVPRDERQPEIRPLFQELKKLIEELRTKPSPADDRQVRLAQAVLANAQRKFVETLRLLPAKFVDSGYEAATNQVELAIEENRLRGYALYCRGAWKEALTCYERILHLDPNHWYAKTLAANCQLSLGRLTEATSRYHAVVAHYTRLVEREGRTELANDLAGSHNNRGNALASQGKLDDAIGDHQKAIEIRTRLVEREGRTELANDLAGSHNNRGLALAGQGRLDDAIGDYQKAIEIRTRLVEREGRTELANDLAGSHNNRGLALADQGKLDDAIGDHQKAIEIRTRLVEREGRTELANYLAGSHNNHGLALAGQGRLDDAIGDHQKAIEIFTRLVEREGRTELANDLASSHNNRGLAFASQGKLDDAIGDYQKAIEIRTRLVEREGRTELANYLAGSHNNRGLAFASQGKLDDATLDFQKAIEIYTQLVECEERSELANDLASAQANLQKLEKTLTEQ